MGRKAGGADACSSTAMRNPEVRRASARAQPTGPAPRIMTSSIAHQRFDVLGELRRLGGDDLASGLGDYHVVLDAHADIAQRLGHIVGRPDIEPGLDGEGHAGSERAPVARALVFAS